MKAVILAGGRGRRLEPYTSVLPKPLMPVGERAIVEIIIDRLVDHGITDITLCVGYLAHLIRAVFDGRPRKADLHYVYEEEARGTAGPLRLVPGLDETFITMNGDLLTDLDFGAFVDYHRTTGNLLTIASHRRTETLDYGVLRLGEGESQRLVAYEEKPRVELMVSMGIYAFEPQALRHIPEGTYYDLPDLVHRLLDLGLPVGAYPFDGYWLDIGRREDYERALDQWPQQPTSLQRPAHH